jgi:hypothetical protein
MLENYEKIYAVIERLQKRETLRMICQESHNKEHTLLENNIEYYCHDKAPSGAQYNFICSSFNCPVQPGLQFSCNESPNAGSMSEYSKCGTSDTQYECNDKSGFVCDVLGTSADYFDCITFDCGNDNSKYSCKTDVDFLCTGEEYNCISEFECNAGHLYACQ